MRFLHFRYSFAAIARHTQIAVDNRDVPRIETEMAVHRTDKTTHGHQRGSKQHRTNRNLDHQQQVSHRNAPPNRSAPSPFDDLAKIAPEYLAHRN
jgi:hypothetical protein